MKRSKKYRETIKKYDKSKSYSKKDACKTVRELSIAKFESSIDAHIKLNLSEEEIKRTVKGTVMLPHSFRKEQKIIVFTNPANAEKAKKKGAVEAGLEELIKKIQTGWFDFDIAIATPDVMPKIAVLGKTLGTRGLMPNPKNGTITTDVEKTIEEFKGGKVSFKSDKQGVVHLPVGKTTMEAEKIEENLSIFIKALQALVKKITKLAFGSITLAPSMGPSVKVDIDSLE